MDIHEINQILREQAIKAGLCKDWQERIWNKDLSLTQLLLIYKRGIDFSLKQEWFDYGFIKKVFPMEELHENLIYMDEEVDIRDAESGTWVFLGECTGSIVFKDFSIGNLYVRHNSEISVRSVDFAKVFISVYDEAEVTRTSIDGGIIKYYDRRK